MGIGAWGMAAAYTQGVSKLTRVSTKTPVLRSVKGVLKKADLKDYKRHLVTKYS